MRQNRRAWALAVAAALAALLVAAQALKFDFGDAPDPPYPSLLRANGPSGPALLALGPDGNLVADVILGNCVSVEDRPQVVDLDGCDDVSLILDLESRLAHFSIRRRDPEASGQYYINLLIDFSRDGVWDPMTPEWLVRNCVVGAGGLLVDRVTCQTEPLDTGFLLDEGFWMRVMVSDLAAPAEPGWDGSAFFPPGGARGEVEDHGPDATPTPPPPPDDDADFGDAEDPSFPSLRNSNGPFIPPADDNLTLGLEIDYEPDANIVDNDAKDDGLLGIDFGARTAAVGVASTLNWTPRDMFVNILVDLDRGGDWDEANEWVVRNCPVPHNIQHFFGGVVICATEVGAEAIPPIDPTNAFLRGIQNFFRALAGFPPLPDEGDAHWIRVLLSEHKITAATWQGAYPAGVSLEFGEVEDYFESIQDTPLKTPTPYTPFAPPPLRTTTAPSSTAIITPTITVSPTVTLTPTPSDTATITPTFTQAPPMALVNVDNASCRHGPSSAFLFKYGLSRGTEVTIIARRGDWLLVRPKDYPEPCWIWSPLLDVVQGDLSQLAVYDFVPYLPREFEHAHAPENVVAERQGRNVRIGWTPADYIPVNDRRGYLLHLIVCRNGVMVEMFVHTDGSNINVEVDDNCSRQSTATVYVVHKDGYSEPKTINLP